MRLLAPALVLVAFAAGCGSGGGGSGGSTNGGGMSTSSTTSVQVQLQEQSFSGEDGTATLTAQGDQTRVDIVMASYAANAQPAHIHKGTCARLDPTPAYPLHDIVVGKSVSVVPISLASLLKGKYAINVHRSAKKVKVYVACGDISKNAAPVPTVTSGEGGSG